MNAIEELNILDNVKFKLDYYVWAKKVYNICLNSNSDDKVLKEWERRISIYKAELQIWLKEAKPIFDKILEEN